MKKTRLEVISRSMLLGRFDPSLRERLADLMDDPDTEAMLVFRNEMIGSREHGEVSVLPVGARRKSQSIEEWDGGWLNDLPSERRYPVSVAFTGALPQGNYRVQDKVWRTDRWACASCAGLRVGGPVEVELWPEEHAERPGPCGYCGREAHGADPS